MEEYIRQEEVTQSESASPPADVELLLGPYRSGKTIHLINELLDLKSRNPFANVLILVPSARYGRILKDRINKALSQSHSPTPSDPKAKSGSLRTAGGSPAHVAALAHPAVPRPPLSGLFGLTIQPFYQACLSIVSTTRGEPEIIAEELRPHLLAEIIAQMNAEAKISSLARIASFHGTSASVLELIDEFQRAGLSPDDLIAKLEESSCAESHLFELANLYARYFACLKELGYYDQKSLALTAREDLFAQRKSADEYELILIDGFDRISHLQAQVFAGFARRARRTMISFDYLATVSTDGSDPHMCRRAAGGPEASAVSEGISTKGLSQEADDYRWKGLSQQADDYRWKGLSQQADDYRWKDSSFNELSRNLNPKIRKFALPEKAATPAIEAVSLLDPFLEMVEVARKIKIALKNRRISFEDLIVVTRSPDSYNGAIEAAFEDAGIPYFIDGSTRIKELAPWQFLFNLLTLSTNDFRRKDFIDLLRSPYMNLEALSLQARDVSTIDRESYNAKLIGGVQAWKKFLSAESYAPIFEPIMQLLTLLNHGEEAASATVHATKVENIIEKYMIFPGSSSDLKSIEANQERESIKALRRLLKVLLMEAELLALGPEPFEDFWRRFEKLADNSNYARPRPETPAVTICSAELVPNIRFKEIYICGLLEGEFPRHQRSRGFLSRDEVQAWYSFGIDIRNPRQEPGFERALFYSLTERCSERLHLSLCQFAGRKSEETIPSFYLSEVLEIANQSGPQSVGVAHGDTRLMRIKPFEQRKAASIRDALTSALWSGGVDAADAISAANESIGYKWQNLRKAMASTLARESMAVENLFNGYLAELYSAGALSYSGQEAWTATKINDYGKCPFRFWASHILSLKPREEAEAGLNLAQTGQFYHKVLELFFKQTHANAKASAGAVLSMDPDWKPAFDKAFADGVDWLEKRGDFQPSAYWQQEMKTLHFRLSKFLEKELRRLDTANSLYQPSMFEVGFGTKPKDEYPPLVLKDQEGKDIVISGTIDRVDLEVADGTSRKGKRARVIDYKSGSKRISPKEAEIGRNLQLPIYALALEQCILPDHIVGEGDYLSINAAASVGHINFDGEKHTELKQAARELVGRYASSARSGVFTVKPNGQVSCSDCPHANVCRVKELSLQLEVEENAFAD